MWKTEEKGHSLVRVDRLELDSFISVHPPTRRAAAVEVLLDVVPAELTDLQRESVRYLAVALEEQKGSPGNRKDKA